MTSDSKTISIIIPAFNEELHIANTLENLHKFLPEAGAEIVVIDNGSTDKTPMIAKRFNITYLSLPVGNVSAVRNYGVRHSNGDVLIFIDADVNVTEKWQKNIDETTTRIIENKNQILGSRCQPISNTSILSKYWYSRLNQTKTNYINSGHMITSRYLFNKIGGFDESLVTAEDYDFCGKAKKNNATVEEVPQLVVTHPGYPKTIIGFIKREIWHGKEDFMSIPSILESKMAWVSIFNLILLASTILASVVYEDLGLLFLYPISALAMCVVLTLVKFGKNEIQKLPGTSLMFFCYIWGRSLSLPARLKIRHH